MLTAQGGWTLHAVIALLDTDPINKCPEDIVPKWPVSTHYAGPLHSGVLTGKADSMQRGDSVLSAPCQVFIPHGAPAGRVD